MEKYKYLLLCCSKTQRACNVCGRSGCTLPDVDDNEQRARYRNRN